MSEHSPCSSTMPASSTCRSVMDEMTRSPYRRMMTINAIGPILCAREAVKRMSTAKGGKGGVIVNVSSAAALIGGPGEYVDYAASKGASIPSRSASPRKWRPKASASPPCAPG